MLKELFNNYVSYDIEMRQGIKFVPKWTI